MARNKKVEHNTDNNIAARGLVNVLVRETSEVDGKELHDYIKRIFPDTYDRIKTENTKGRHEFFKSLDEEAVKNSWNRFLRGNHSDSKKNFGAPYHTQLLQEDLNDKNNISYRAEIADSKHVTPRANMIQNIKDLIVEKELLNRKQSLWEYYNEKELYNDEIKAACKSLYESSRLEAYAYLIFLLFCISFFQWEIDKIDNLYDKNTIDEKLGVIKREKESIKKSLTSQSIESLLDEHYQATYFVYMQRPTYEHVYKKGELILVADEEAEYSYAELNLEDEMFVPHQEGLHPLYKKYKGETILNKRDKLVYSVMLGINGTIGIMTFRYDSFNYAGMLFRSGLFISSYPGKNVPLVQKMLISAKEIKDENLIKGLLKVDSSLITIDKEGLDEFVQTYESAHWMNDFKKRILPFILNHAKITYSFTPEELYHFSLPHTDTVDRIEIIELLKSYAMNSDMIECVHLDKTNRLIGEYEKRHS